METLEHLEHLDYLEHPQFNRRPVAQFVNHCVMALDLPAGTEWRMP